MPQSKTPMMKASDMLAVSNPFDALLPEPKLRDLQGMPEEKRQQFYGRVVDSVFSDPAYLSLVQRAANTEFDRLAGGGSSTDDDLRGVVADVVSEVLRRRGR